MDKQRAVNTVTANDEYSKQLMKMYENWMGGDCFQGSNIKEEEIPTGQKQGGGTGAAFKSAIGELPAIEYDKSGAIPTPSVVNSDDGSQKDPKSNANPGEPPVALKGTMTIGQGSMSTGQPQSHGAQLKNMTLVSKEQVEIDGEMYVIEKAKGLDGKACWKGYKLAGTKKKGGKTVDNCVKAGFEPEGEQLEEKKAKKDYDGDGKVESGKDEYFGSRDKAIKKAMGKKAMKKEHHEKDIDGKVIPHGLTDEDRDKDLGRDVGDATPSSVEEASLATARKNIGRDPKKASCWKGYKASGTKMKGGKSVPDCKKEEIQVEHHQKDKDGNTIPHNDVVVEKKLDPVGKADADIDNDGDVDKSDKYLHARRKKISKVIAMSKKK